MDDCRCGGYRVVTAVRATSTGCRILCAGGWNAEPHRALATVTGLPNASRALAFGRRCGRGPLGVVAPCRKGRGLVDAPASSASAAATLRRATETGRLPCWADPVDGWVHDPAQSVLLWSEYAGARSAEPGGGASRQPLQS